MYFHNFKYVYFLFFKNKTCIKISILNILQNGEYNMNIKKNISLIYDQKNSERESSEKKKKKKL